MPKLSNWRPMMTAVASLLLLTVVARDTSGAPIDLGNDVGVDWQNDLNCSVPEEAAQIANFPKEVCSIPVIGAPRLVPDARNARTLVKIGVDFIDTLAFGDLILNVGDSSLNEIILPGTSVPLRLTYEVPAGVHDFLNLTLADFPGSDELPAGDLVFSVGGSFSFDLPDQTGRFPADRREPGARITLSGLGTVLAVPEPHALSLLLCGLCGVLAGRRFLS